MRIGKSGNTVYEIDLAKVNRHGLIAGATGTGKTVTLQTLAEGFSLEGIPVFCADVKGDLAGIAMTDDDLTPYTTFWDLYGERGIPIRASLQGMGSLLISRMMNLTKVQEGVLAVTFKYAMDMGLAIHTLTDFRLVLQTIAKNHREVSALYGNVTEGSIGAIQRAITMFEQEGADRFFGTPELDISDMFTRTIEGRGMINILSAEKLMSSPQLYSSFLLWMLNEMFIRLPEVGDLEQPKFVFIFDEAHLLFSDGSDALIKMIGRIVRLIRSKGVGVYFVTQSPSDIPDGVLAQLSNRYQHALRAFTPRDERSVRVAAQTFRPNPKFKTADVIRELQVGEALVSTLNSKGEPGIVQRVRIDLPQSRLGPISDYERKQLMNMNVFAGKYRKDYTPGETSFVTPKKHNPVAFKVIGLIFAVGTLAPIGGCVYAGYLVFKHTLGG